MQQPRGSYLLSLRLTCFFIACSGLLLMVPEPAMAQTSPMGNVMCQLVAIIYGNLGRAIAVLSVIVIGIGATLGKITWGLALTVGTGIATVFGAVPLVMYLIGVSQICFDVGGIR